MSNRTLSPAKRIFIVEDHPSFREGLRAILNQDAVVSICGEAGNFTTALDEIERLNPDLALIDISLPNGSGLNLIRKLRAANQELKLLVVSMHDEALFANRALLAGADGYIMKQEDPEELLHAIHDVLNGHTYLSEDILNRKQKAGASHGKPRETRLDQLTDRELEILEWIGRGKTNLEIARILREDTRSIVDARITVREKLALLNNQALIRYAVSWVEKESL